MLKKKILIAIAAGGTALAMLPLFAAFEAHVINVTAKIENALSVPVNEIKFGTVFPQEKLDKTFDVFLSQSFIEEDRVDDVEYFIRQKPKCGLPIPETKPVQYSEFEPAIEDGQGNFTCERVVGTENHVGGYVLLPLLCPYLSKHEISTDGILIGRFLASAVIARRIGRTSSTNLIRKRTRTTTPSRSRTSTRLSDATYGLRFRESVPRLRVRPLRGQRLSPIPRIQ